MARKLDEEKRSNILASARTIFGENGYQRTTIKQIAAAAGIAQGTLYTYFANKEELFTAAVEEIWKRVFTGLRRISSGSGSFVDKLVGFTDFGFDLLTDIHPLLRGMFSEANRRSLLLERVDEVCEFIGEFFTDARSRGVLFSIENSPEVRRFNLRMMVSGVLFRAALSPPESLADELAAIKTGFINGIAEGVQARTR